MECSVLYGVSLSDRSFDIEVVFVECMVLRFRFALAFIDLYVIFDFVQ